VPVAGRSLRPSWASLTRCRLRFGIRAFACQQRRLPGTGSPSLPLVAQVVNLCAFPRDVQVLPVVLERNGHREADCQEHTEPDGDPGAERQAGDVAPRPLRLR